MSIVGDRVVLCKISFLCTRVGTEPWTFYFKNMFLNMNITFLLALLSTAIITVRVSNNVYWVVCSKIVVLMYWENELKTTELLSNIKS